MSASSTCEGASDSIRNTIEDEEHVNVPTSRFWWRSRRCSMPNQGGHRPSSFDTGRKTAVNRAQSPEPRHSRPAPAQAFTRTRSVADLLRARPRAIRRCSADPSHSDASGPPSGGPFCCGTLPSDPTPLRQSFLAPASLLAFGGISLLRLCARSPQSDHSSGCPVILEVTLVPLGPRSSRTMIHDITGHNNCAALRMAYNVSALPMHTGCVHALHGSAYARQADARTLIEAEVDGAHSEERRSAQDAVRR